MIEQNIKDLIYKQDPHAGMNQLFFTNKDLFNLSYEAMFKKQWVCLTHLSYFDENEVFTYQINDSFIEQKSQSEGYLEKAGLKLIAKFEIGATNMHNQLWSRK